MANVVVRGGKAVITLDETVTGLEINGVGYEQCSAVLRGKVVDAWEATSVADKTKSDQHAFVGRAYGAAASSHVSNVRNVPSGAGTVRIGNVSVSGGGTGKSVVKNITFAAADENNNATSGKRTRISKHTIVGVDSVQMHDDGSATVLFDVV